MREGLRGPRSEFEFKPFARHARGPSRPQKRVRIQTLCSSCERAFAAPEASSNFKPFARHATGPSRLVTREGLPSARSEFEFEPFARDARGPSRPQKRVRIQTLCSSCEARQARGPSHRRSEFEFKPFARHARGLRGSSRVKALPGARSEFEFKPFARHARGLRGSSRVKAFLAPEASSNSNPLLVAREGFAAPESCRVRKREGTSRRRHPARIRTPVARCCKASASG